MLTAIIIDDEPHCISALKYDIDLFCPDIEVVDTCSNGEDGLSSIKANNPDIVFLDIEMPGMNGLQMLDELNGNIHFQLVFTTAHDKFAARAFRLSAVDYLLKPIDSIDLKEAVEKAKGLLPQDNVRRLNNLRHNLIQPFSEQRIALPQRDGFDLVKVKDIAYCRADGAYTLITLAGGRQMMLSRSLGEVGEMLLPELFERIHHSTLVNINFITRFIKKDGAHIVMDDGTELAISKSRREQVLVRLGLIKY